MRRALQRAAGALYCAGQGYDSGMTTLRTTAAAASLLLLLPFAAAQQVNTSAAPPRDPGPAAHGGAVAHSIPLKPLAHVEVRGTGKTDLILIPGLSCDWTVYESFMERNKDRYRMFAVTLPGFGGSEPPARPDGASPAEGLWLRNAEDAIIAMMKERGITSPYVMGHSMGGHLALRLAADHGDLFAGAISLDGLPLFPPPQPGQQDDAKSREQMAVQMARMIGAMPAERWREGQKQSVAMMVKDPARGAAIGELCATVPAPITAAYMSEMICSDVRPRVGQIKIPTMLISPIPMEAGPENAQIMRETVIEEFRGAGPSVAIVNFDDTRHFVTEDRPAELDAAVADFVARKPVKGVTVPGLTPPGAGGPPVAPKGGTVGVAPTEAPPAAAIPGGSGPPGGPVPAAVQSMPSHVAGPGSPAVAGLGAETVARTLDQLKALAGNWDADTDGDGKPDSTVNYRVIAGGSAVVETLFPGTPHEMETIFHADGPRLLCTHYCAEGNQPRLSLMKVAPYAAEFAMIDATNLKGPGAQHMGALRIEFIDKDHIKTVWTSFKDNKPGHVASFDLKRRQTP